MTPTPPEQLVALELRWFLRGGLPPAVEQWFRRGLAAQESDRDARTDSYLSGPWGSNASVKLREGRLEIKHCEWASGLEAHGFAGQLQRWVKWVGRLETPVPDANLGLTAPLSPWIAVQKERWQKKFEWRGSAFAPVNSRDKVATGVAIEIGRIAVGGHLFGTVLVEAFAPDEELERSLLVSALDQLCSAYPNPRPVPEDSYSYPQLLISTMPVDPSTRSARLTAIVAMDYDYLTRQLLVNEEMGEKRVALFLTLTAGIGAAAMLASERLGTAMSGRSRELLLAVNAVWLVLGFLTLRRIFRRNRQTDELKAQLSVLRGHYVQPGDVEGRRTLPYDPYGQLKTDRTLRLWQGSGGFAEMVALVNAVAAGVLVCQAGYLVLEVATLIGIANVPPPLMSFLADLSGLITGLRAWQWQRAQSAVQ